MEVVRVSATAIALSWTVETSLYSRLVQLHNFLDT